MFPIFLANQIKLVLGITDYSKLEVYSSFLVEKITLKPFNDIEVTNLINQSFYKLVPHRDLINLILSFSERTPAAILDFLSQLIITKIISFSNFQFEIEYNEDKITELLTSQNQIFEILLQNLTIKEISILEIISLFQIEISSNLIAEVLLEDDNEIRSIVNNLRLKNILHPVTNTRNANFINEGFKKFIYSNIKGLSELHYKAGLAVMESFPDMNILNKVRQFELAERFDIANEIIDSDLKASNIKNFPQLKKKLLQKKLSYELNESKKVDINLMLIEIEIILGNYNSAVKLDKHLSGEEIDENQKLLKNKYLGIVLIRTGAIKDGINLLVQIVDSLADSKNEIFLEIANAYIDINNYDEADLICKEIIKSESKSSEIMGRAQNLLGISCSYHSSDLKIALKYFTDSFKTYTK